MLSIFLYGSQPGYIYIYIYNIYIYIYIYINIYKTGGLLAQLIEQCIFSSCGFVEIPIQTAAQ